MVKINLEDKNYYSNSTINNYFASNTISKNYPVSIINQKSSANTCDQYNFTQNVSNPNSGSVDNSKASIIAQLKKSKEELRKNFEKEKESQGWVGSSVDFVKGIFGFGSKKVEKNLDSFDKKFEELEEVANSGNDELFGQKYKELTGKDLDLNETDPDKDLLEGSDIENDIKGYSESQKTITDVVADVASGIASFGCYAAAAAGLVAAPFTGGSSLLVTVGALSAATAVGAAVKTGIKATDAWSAGREYTSKDFVYDAVTGGVNGLLAPVSFGIGGVIGKTVATKLGVQVVKEGITTTAEQGAKNAVLSTANKYVSESLGKKALAYGTDFAVQGAVMGGPNGAIVHRLNTGSWDRTGEAFIEGTVAGAITSVFMNGGIKAAVKGFGSITGKSGKVQEKTNVIEDNSFNVASEELDYNFAVIDSAIEKESASLDLMGNDTAKPVKTNNNKNLGISPFASQSAPKVIGKLETYLKTTPDGKTSFDFSDLKIGKEQFHTEKSVNILKQFKDTDCNIDQDLKESIDKILNGFQDLDKLAETPEVLTSLMTVIERGNKDQIALLSGLNADNAKYLEQIFKNRYAISRFQIPDIINYTSTKIKNLSPEELKSFRENFSYFTGLKNGKKENALNWDKLKELMDTNPQANTAKYLKQVINNRCSITAEQLPGAISYLSNKIKNLNPDELNNFSQNLNYFTTLKNTQGGNVLNWNGVKTVIDINPGVNTSKYIEQLIKNENKGFNGNNSGSICLSLKDINSKIKDLSPSELNSFDQQFSYLSGLKNNKGEAMMDLSGIQKMMKELDPSSPNYNDYNLLLKLAETGEIPSYMFERMAENGEINELVLNDAKLLNQALKEGKDPKDVFVPTFKNIQESLKQVEVGDVCKVDGFNKVFFKLSKSQLVQLDINKDTYYKLFPPVQRFAVAQGKIGDCYLVTALLSEMNDPVKRLNLLKYFSQEGNDIKVTLPANNKIIQDLRNLTGEVDASGRVSYTVKNGEFTPADPDRLMKGAIGLQLLEHTYGINLKYQRTSEYFNYIMKQIKANPSNAAKLNDELFKITENFEKNMGDIVFIKDQNGIISSYKTLTEINNENMKNHVLPFKTVEDYYRPSGKPGVVFELLGGKATINLTTKTKDMTNLLKTIESILKINQKLTAEERECLKSFKSIIEEYTDHLKTNPKDSILFEEYKSKILKNNSSAENITSILEALRKLEKNTFLNGLNSQDKIKAFGTAPKPGTPVESSFDRANSLYSSHAYGITDFNSNTEEVFYFNPWNSSQICNQTIDELLSYVNTIHLAPIR